MIGNKLGMDSCNSNNISTEQTDDLELYELLKAGLEDVTAGRTKPFSEAMAEIRATRKR